MQRLTTQEASTLCAVLMDAKRRLLAEQVEALRRGVGGEGLLDQLRVVDKAIALIVTRIAAQKPPTLDSA